MDINLLSRKSLTTSLIVLCLWSTLVYAGNPVHILVITSSNDAPYQEAIYGFKTQLSSAGKIKFTEMTLGEAKSTDNIIKSLNPDLIYALGSETTKWAGKETSRIPIIGSMVIKDDTLKMSPNMTGVCLGHSLKTQFQWVKKIFSSPKTIAILYNPAENAATIEAAKNISQQEGFKLIAIPVESPQKLPYALEQLANNIDLLMAIPDETVMSVNTAREVLLSSFSNKVPLIGLSDNWVKSGAFYSLSWDYDDLGRQSATLAQKILNGSSVQSVSYEHPRKVAYSINAKIAEHMNFDIPEGLLKNAKQVFN
jgi:putative tryptophan/tyrosine transport system substrate-binding protein